MSKIIGKVNSEIEQLVGRLILQEIQNRYALEDMVKTIEMWDLTIPEMNANSASEIDSNP